MSEKKVRVRFAPSPTGALHMGGVRTALFNYLFARQHGGDFLLRIEDTDSNRFVPGAEDYIIESLKWCGIQIDEGVSVGGPHGPYRQSERKDIYIEYISQLLSEGKAYYAFDSEESLSSIRESMKQNGDTFIYNHSTRLTLDNSLTKTKEEVDKRIANGEQYVVRLLITPNEIIECNDLIRGKVTVNSSTLDDKVLWKSADQLPTYHLANIVDDHLMQISHVIRGEEWLPSMPLHILLYRAFSWEAPEFAHLSLILKPAPGKGKLSKRDGVTGGYPVFPLEWHDKESEETFAGYRESGYMPEAFINAISLLGWNPGTNEELFTMEDLISKFDISRVIKSGAKFDPNKTRWFNSQWIKRSSFEKVIENIDEKSMICLIDYFKQNLGDKRLKLLAYAISKVKNKASFVTDIPGLVMSTVSTPEQLSYDMSEYPGECKAIAMEVISNTLNVKGTEINQYIYDICKEANVDFKKVSEIIRYIITGVKNGISAGDILYINKFTLTEDRIVLINKMLK